MLRKFLLSTALVMTAASASAADLPYRTAAPAPFAGAVPVFTWTGFYVGAHAGYAWSKINGTTTASDGVPGVIAGRESADVSNNDWNAGVQAGYNYQFSNGVVVGAEADWTWLNGGSTSTDFATSAAYLNQTQGTISYDQDWMATARVRLGYSFGPVLVYGTGGLAALRETETRTQYVGTGGSPQVVGTTAAAFSESDKRTRLGWTLGAGAEWAFATNWSVKAEYLYARFERESFFFPNARGGVGNNFANVTGRIARNEADLQTVRVGVNYKF